MNYIIREIEKSDDKKIEAVIRSCLIEFGANHEGTAWVDPDLCMAPKAIGPGGRHLGLLGLDVIRVRDALVLAFVDLVFLIVAFRNVTLRILFWIGLIATIVAITGGVALVVVLVFVVIHSSALGCLLAS